MLTLDPDTAEFLKKHGVTDPVIEVTLGMTEEILAAGDDVVRDTDDDAFDDQTSKGQLHYRRSRNRIDSRYAKDPSVSCDTTDNAFQVHVDGVKVSFYSAREGLEHPKVEGSPSKKRVVDEFQMMLDVDDAPEVKRLVLMHVRGDDGVVQVALGALESSTKWAWFGTLYDRFAMDTGDVSTDHGPAYDALPEAELPPMERHRQDDQQHNDSGSVNVDPA